MSTLLNVWKFHAFLKMRNFKIIWKWKITPTALATSCLPTLDNTAITKGMNKQNSHYCALHTYLWNQDFLYPKHYLTMPSLNFQFDGNKSLGNDIVSYLPDNQPAILCHSCPSEPANSYVIYLYITVW